MAPMHSETVLDLDLDLDQYSADVHMDNIAEVENGWQTGKMNKKVKNNNFLFIYLICYTNTKLTCTMTLKDFRLPPDSHSPLKKGVTSGGNKLGFSPFGDVILRFFSCIFRFFSRILNAFFL